VKTEDEKQHSELLAYRALSIVKESGKNMTEHKVSETGSVSAFILSGGCWVC
jgi:hypothetical protein